MPINLTDDQKQIGTENFYGSLSQLRPDLIEESLDVQAKRKGMTRRDFIAGAGAGGLGLGALYFNYDKIAGDKVKVGFIGTGLEGQVLLNEHPTDYMEIVAIADLRPYMRNMAFTGQGNETRRGLNKILGKEPAANIKQYEDHKQLLEAHPEIEAVVIAVPLSQHAPVAIDCMNAGKHVLCEKLMARTITECKEMIRVAEKNDVLLAVGHQRHYSVLYDNANFLIKQGLLGDIKFIRANWHRNNSFYGKDSWRKAPPKIDQDAYAEGDSQQKLNDFGYNDLFQLVNWRLYNTTGAGLMAELGSHQLDACSIFLGKVKPIAVQGYGGRDFYGIEGVGPKDKWDDDREVYDQVHTTFEFPGPKFDAERYADDPTAPNDKVVVTYSSINTNRQEPYGETIFGSRGTLMMIQEKDSYLFKEGSSGTGPGGFDQRLNVLVNKSEGPILEASESLAPATAVAQTAVAQKISRGYTEEMEHLCYCIRNNIKAPPSEGGLKCNGTVAMGDAIMALTSNIAMALQRRVEFKPEWFDPNSDATPEEDLLGDPNSLA